MVYNIDNYIGKTINKWTVLSYSHKNEKGDQHWLCKCKCGLEKPVRASHLIRELNKGCRYCRGQASRNSDSPYWKGGEFISASILTSCKICAKKRKIPFNIAIKDIENQWIKQNGKCIYTGELLTLPKNNRDKSFNCSIDRVDSDKGYTPDNIQWVLKDINLMKMDLKEERFLELCKMIGTCGV